MAPICLNCGFDNPPGMRFCGNCGTRLVEAAPQQKIDPESRPALAPEQLGVLTGADLLERFRQAGLEASGQRRSVTVLFVDLSGYTTLSEELGDEELYELVQKFIRLLVNDVYKYEGMVDKLTGDGLMALFGAPIAHENNAERALRSALDMIDDVTRLSRELQLDGRELRIHVGLNAGSVIVGGLGGNGLMNYTAIGDSVNMARRLEETADPGMILVSESVYRQTNRLFDFQATQPLSLKNISRPVTAYRYIAPKDRPMSVRGLEGLHAPMIGRENELHELQRAVDRLVNQQQGGVVLLAGEGGMGKSRLTSELKERLDTSALRVLEGHSLTYRKAIAYWIFQDVLREYLDANAETPEGELRARLAERVQVVLGQSTAREKLAYLEHMLSLEPSDPEIAGRIRYLEAGQLRQQIFMAVRDLLLAEARRKPLLLILEDLHWADDASLDLLRFLIDSTRSAPLLVYAISRPFEGGAVQAIHERASQRLGDRYMFIRLQALPPNQSARLLVALLAIQDLPESLRAQIVQRSAGLPFYLEEILRMLIENHVIFNDGTQWRLTPGADASAVGVPETLQGLILARFDRLDPIQRQVLQTASVIGYQFSGQVLYQVMALHGDELVREVQSALDYLVEHEYVVPQANSAGEDSFVFRHVLVSDAVYSTLLQRDRRDLHTRVGQAIEQIYAGRLEGLIEVLAGHFLRSLLLDRALHYLILSGQKAARSYANEQARQHFTQALEVLSKVEHTPEQSVEIYIGLGDALLIAGDYPAARNYFLRGLEELGVRSFTGMLSERRAPEKTDTAWWSERKRTLSMLQRKVARTHESQGDYDRALSCLKASQRLLAGRTEEYAAEVANIMSDMGWIHFRRSNLDQAEEVLLDALKLAEESQQPDVLASVLNRLAGIYFQRDVPEQAARYLMRSLVLREKIGDVGAVARSYNNLGLLGWKQGDLTGALNNFNHSFQLQANLGDVEGLIVLHTNIGLIELDRGNLSEAESRFQAALESAEQIGHFFHVCNSRMHLALLNVYAANWTAVIEQGQLGLKGFQELGITENQLDLNVSLGWAYLGMADHENLGLVVQRIDQLLKESRAAGGQSEGEGRAMRLFGRIWAEHGSATRARDALEKSAAIFTQSGNQMERCRTLVDMAGLLAVCGEKEKARGLLAESREVFERMGARMDLESLERIDKLAA